MLQRTVQHSLQPARSAGVLSIVTVKRHLHTSIIQHNIYTPEKHFTPEKIVYHNIEDDNAKPGVGAINVFKNRKDTETVVISFLREFDRLHDTMQHATPQQLQQIAQNIDFKQLDLDSLDQVELLVLFEQKFGVEISDEDSDQIKGVKHLVDYVVAHPKIQIADPYDHQLRFKDANDAITKQIEVINMGRRRDVTHDTVAKQAEDAAEQEIARSKYPELTKLRLELDRQYEEQYKNQPPPQISRFREFMLVQLEKISQRIDRAKSKYSKQQ